MSRKEVFKTPHISIDFISPEESRVVQDGPVGTLLLKNFRKINQKEVSRLLSRLTVDELIIDSWQVSPSDAWFSDGLFEGLLSLPRRILFVGCDEELIEWVAGNLIVAVGEHRADEVVTAVAIDDGRKLEYREDSACWWLNVCSVSGE